MARPADATVTQLGYLIFGVSDVDAWRDFMICALGLQENGRGADGSALFRLDRHHHRFGIRPSGEDDVVVVGWQCRDAEAMAAIAARLRARGVEVEAGTEQDAAARMVLGLIKFTAPGDLATEVYYGPLIEHRPFVSPRGVAGFKADDLGLGHIVINSRDVDADLPFYTEGLGFKVSDIIRSTVPPLGRKGIFTHCNPRHHSLALGTPIDPAKTTKRLNHFMLETNRLYDVGGAVDQFTLRGELAGPISCHTNDHMVSCYARTPSGFTIEYGCNGRLIDDDSWRVQLYGAPRVWGHALPPATAEK